MINILFVDDEINVLQGLRRMLRPMRHEWKMSFANSAPEALELMEKRAFHVLISDMRMPGMDGVQLLIEVRRRYPETIRIILSGQANEEKILKSVGPAHQYLMKPCDAETLKSKVEEAFASRNFVPEKSLRSLVSQMQTLPSLPALYAEINEEVKSPKSSIERVGRIISKDLAMTMKILQIVNSAFFGLPRRITSPEKAASFLGLNMIASLVLGLGVFSQFRLKKIEGFSAEDLWSHSISVGASARQIARLESGNRDLADDAFLSGLVHDVGKLLLAQNLPEEYSRALALARESGMLQWQAEEEVFGPNHAQAGAYLLGLWGLPDAIAQAVGFHHCPLACPERTFSALTTVHVANGIHRNALAGAKSSPASSGKSTKGSASQMESEVDANYLTSLGLRKRFPDWTEACRDLDQEGGEKT